MSKTDPRPGNGTSTDQLVSRLTHIEQTLDKRNNAWYRTPSNVISLLAVIVTVLIFLFSFFSARHKEAVSKQQQVRRLIDQLSTLTGEETELYRTPMAQVVRAQAQIAIANRRNVLISEVESLLADVEKRLSKPDLAMLSVAYASAGFYEKAAQHMTSLANAKEERTSSRVMAWRSLVAIYGQLGPKHIDRAIMAAETGMGLIDTTNLDPFLRTELVTIPYSLATGLAIAGRYDEAFRYFTDAEKNAMSLPCTAQRWEYLALLQVEIEKVLPLVPRARKRIRELRATYSKSCPGDHWPAAPDVNQAGGFDSATGSPANGFSGTYQFEFHSLSIEADTSGNLHVKKLGGQPTPLARLGKDLYASQIVPGQFMSFQRNASGHVTHLLLLQPNGSFVMRRK